MCIDGFWLLYCGMIDRLLWLLNNWLSNLLCLSMSLDLHCLNIMSNSSRLGYWSLLNSWHYIWLNLVSNHSILRGVEIIHNGLNLFGNVLHHFGLLFRNHLHLRFFLGNRLNRLLNFINHIIKLMLGHFVVLFVLPLSFH